MGTIRFSGYTHRFLARFVIEVETPLAVGSGEKDILTDALVATDVNGLPYIPGTAIAGVVRHMIEEVKPQGFDVNQIFGFQKEQDGHGSEIIFTEAKIINSKGEVVDGVNLDAIKTDPLLQNYDKLPIRQHVRINDKGVTDKAGKFDEQVVFAGTRFCFELEMLAKDDTINNFNKIIEQIQSRIFRIGGGTRCGFGEIEVKELYKRSLNLKDSGDLELYLAKSSDLSKEWQGWDKKEPKTEKSADGWIKYELHLQPEDFFLFGSGFGDDEVDMTPVKEKKVVWDDDSHGHLSEELVLIPAASVKGALAHRVAFHYNRLKERFSGCTGDKEPKVGNENEAVQALFGYENQKEKKQVRGNVIFNEVIQDTLPDKVLNHVSIDRFTGGAIESALFDEKVLFGNGKSFTTKIMVDKTAFEGDPDYKIAFESALKDLIDGLLPLGGGVNRGNGCFGGSVKEINGTFNHKREIESW